MKKTRHLKRVLYLVMALLMAFTALAVSLAQAEASGEVKQLSMSRNTSTKLNVDEKLQITLSGAEATAWKSSKPKVATVSNTGLVTAKTKGKTKITITTSKKKKLTLTLTVANPYEAKKVAFSKKSITISVGSSETLVPVLTPKTAKTTYKWTSSNKKIAKVDANGKVTGVKPGTAKITVKTDNKKKATITVKVKKAPPPKKKHTGPVEEYMGAKIDNFNAEIVDTLKPISDDPGWYSSDYMKAFTKNNVVTRINLTLTTTNLISEIVEQYGKRYTLWGVCPGMSLDAADKTLRSRGWSLKFIGYQYGNESYRNYSATFNNRGYTLRLSYSGTPKMVFFVGAGLD